ncbi:hypothetical protein MPC4_70077 [Methylocella tundrae]|uniref:Uncharacterized protein n=1 Tax=Methylocella tundrae TaxID=227605 RepID=A0A8B6MCV2_METTU|nr:hypothetical protein MPC4_70077 [Methylocella tundrae]
MTENLCFLILHHVLCPRMSSNVNLVEWFIFGVLCGGNARVSNGRRFSNSGTLADHTKRRH